MNSTTEKTTPEPVSVSIEKSDLANYIKYNPQLYIIGLQEADFHIVMKALEYKYKHRKYALKSFHKKKGNSTESIKTKEEKITKLVFFTTPSPQLVEQYKHIIDIK